MKLNPAVSSSFRKCRKAHFTAPSHKRRVMMTAPVSKEARVEHQIKRLPIRRGDEVTIMKGAHKGKSGKVERVCRPNFCVTVEGVTRSNAKGAAVPIYFKAENLRITKPFINKDRERTIARRKVSPQ